MFPPHSMVIWLDVNDSGYNLEVCTVTVSSWKTNTFRPVGLAKTQRLQSFRPKEWIKFLPLLKVSPWLLRLFLPKPSNGQRVTRPDFCNFSHGGWWLVYRLPRYEVTIPRPWRWHWGAWADHAVTSCSQDQLHNLLVWHRQPATGSNRVRYGMVLGARLGSPK